MHVLFYRPKIRITLLAFIYCLVYIIGSLEIAPKHYYAYEFKNTTLIWHGIPTTDAVESRTWRKDGILIAWLNEYGFHEENGYEGRLKYVGNDSITIKGATRNDSGTYKQMAKVKGVNVPLEFDINLQVIGSPANVCAPVITPHGSDLRADLPQEAVCINSALGLEWKDTENKTVNHQNGTAILHLGTDSGGEYWVCTVGEATKYFQGNMSNFCTSYTVTQHQQSRDQLKLPPEIIIPCILVPTVFIIISVLILWHRGVICQKPCKTTDAKSNTLQEMGAENSSLLPKKIPFLDLVHEGNISVSDVYVSLEFEELEMSTDDGNVINMIPQTQLLPTFIMIIGESGSGKSAWCKQLAYCWSQKLGMDEAERQDLKLPPLKNIKHILSLQLEQSDIGITFKELIQRSSCSIDIMTLMDSQNCSQPILITIDGLDKISGNDSLKQFILELSLLKSFTFIFTSRPSCLNQVLLACANRPIKFYKIRKFTPEKSEAYVERVVSVMNENFNINLNPKDFVTFTKCLHVECLLTSPYYCLIILNIWVNNKNPHIQLTAVLNEFLSHLFNHKGLQDVMNILPRQPADFNDFVNIISEIAYKNFKSGKETLMSNESLSCNTDKESIPMQSFINTLIYQFFVSRAGKQLTFEHDLKKILEHFLTIHMVSEMSSDKAKETFKIIRQLKIKSTKGQNEQNINYSIKCKRRNTKNRYVPEKWLQNLMYESKLDNKILSFVTHALRSIESLTILELKNLDNNDDLIFWLPFIKTLKTLKLNISNCTLLLCKEWEEEEESTNLKVVIIESMIFPESTRCVLHKACKNVEKWTIPTPTNTIIKMIFCPLPDQTNNS